MALQRIDTAFGPNPIRFNGNVEPQANANVFLGNTTNQFATIFASTFSGTATFANLAYNLGSGTAINPSSANVAGNIVGYATTVTGNVNTGAIVSRGGLGVAGIGMFGGNVVASSNTQATSTTTGALVSTGGLAITTGNLYIGGSAGNAIIATGDNYNQGNIWVTNTTNAGLRTNQTTAYLFNETATTLRIGGAATSVSIGGATGSIVPNANTTVNLGSSTAFYGTTFTGNIVSNAQVIGAGGLVSAGNIAVNTGTNSGLTTNQTTAYVFNETATTVRIGGGGIAQFNNNTQAISTSTGAIQLRGGMSINTGNLYVGGSGGNALIVTGNIVPSANLISTNNLGSDTQWWNNFYGVSTQARYADLAENYQADAWYAPGTVLEFGGTNEVTLAAEETTRVAGVVSTNPAHLMNGALSGSNVVPLALQGRVPCLVRGPISKGDMIVSAGSGYAKASSNPILGTVIGKSLENFTGDTGVIEVVIGRL